MKKISKLLIASSLSLVLAACGNTDSENEDLTPETDQTEDTESTEDTDAVQESEETEDTEDNEENESEEADSNEASDEDVSDEDMASADEEELESAEKVSDYDEYEELSAQDFFNPDDYTSHLVVDNSIKRIFIFEDDNQQAYKTVFIKKANRLKVIDLKNDDLLMNEIID